MAPSREVSWPQPDAPKKSSSPLEALSPNPYYTPSIAEKYGYGTLGAAVGGATVALSNFFAKRPLLAGIYLYPIGIVAGASCVYALQKYKEDQWAQRDAIFRHYISLHPEDFPPYERIKIKDVFNDWTPIR